MFKRCLLLVFNIVIPVMVFVIAGVESFRFGPLLFPSISYTTREPRSEESCGRYVPLLATADFLNREHPGVPVWLDLKSDGSFTSYGIPFLKSEGEQDKEQHGKWAIRNYNTCSIWLTDFSGTNGQVALKMKGQEAPYIVEYWSDFPMQFCTAPQQSHAAYAYKAVSVVDWVLQGGIALSVFVLPLFIKPAYASWVFRCPLLLILAWGGWRMGFFDSVIQNDISGMGYVGAAIAYAAIARGLFAVRCSFVRKKTKQTESMGPDSGIPTTPR